MRGVKDRLTAALRTLLLHCFSGGPWYIHVCTCVHTILGVYAYACRDMHVCHKILEMTVEHASKCIGHDQTYKIYGCKDNCTQQLPQQLQPCI